MRPLKENFQGNCLVKNKKLTNKMVMLRGVLGQDLSANVKGFCWGGKYGDSQIRINHVFLALWDLNQLRNSPKTQMKGEG